MRELTARIRFTKHSLGNVKDRTTGRFMFPRSPNGAITFLSSWHQSNMRFAATLLNLHHDAVKGIYWDIEIDAATDANGWHRRYYTVGGRERYVLHEAMMPGQVVGINCVVPAEIGDEAFWQLLRVAGQYKGLSPFRPGDFGHYDVVGIRPRRATADPEGNQESGLKQERVTEPSTL